MSIQPGDLRPGIERLSDVHYVRRVERDAEAQEFGQKNQGERKKGQRPDEEAPEAEAPRDVVEVRGEAHLSEWTGVPASPLPRPDRLPAASDTRQLPPSASPDRHIDIKV